MMCAALRKKNVNDLYDNSVMSVEIKMTTVTITVDLISQY